HKKSKSGQGFGIGGGTEKGGYVATCVEISVDHGSGDVRVVRIVTAFECGAIVNPDGLRHQVVGANIMGLGGALFESIEFENGRISNPHFAQYRVLRSSRLSFSLSRRGTIYRALFFSAAFSAAFSYAFLCHPDRSGGIAAKFTRLQSPLALTRIDL